MIVGRRRLNPVHYALRANAPYEDAGSDRRLRVRAARLHPVCIRSGPFAYLLHLATGRFAYLFTLSG